MGCIYQIRNTEDDKVYIGSSINPEKRKREHFHHLKNNNHINPHLQNAFNLNPNSFRFEILQSNIPDDKLLECESQELECYLISNLIDRTRCYNLIINPSRPTHSPETRNKISKALMGNKNTPDRTGNKNPMFGKKISSEHKEKIRQLSLNRVFTLEALAKISKANLGKEISIEQRNKIRQALLGRKRPAEVIEKIRQSRFGKTKNS